VALETDSGVGSFEYISFRSSGGRLGKRRCVFEVIVKAASGVRIPRFVRVIEDVGLEIVQR
jgi:hypothetical protein